VVLRGEIPNDHLTVEATTVEHVGVLGVELDGRDFNWRLQHMSKSDDMVVRKVEDENERLEGFSLNHGSQVEVHVVNHAHRDPVWSSGVELNAGYALTFAVIVVDEGPRGHVGGVDLATSSGLIVSEHLKVVLEDIDDLIGLQGLLNSEGDSVNELVKLFLELLGCLDLLFGLLASLVAALSDEVIRVVLDSLVDGSAEIGLSLDLLHLVSSLEAHVEHLHVSKAIADSFDGGLEIDGELLRLLICKVEAILAVFASRSGNPHLELWS
jgi:hypothetical protein